MFKLTFLMGAVCWVFCGSIMYYAERHNPCDKLCEDLWDGDDMQRHYRSVPEASEKPLPPSCLPEATA